MKMITHVMHDWLRALQQKIFCKALMLVCCFTFLHAFASAAGPVTGRVTDDKGNPLPGVTVQVKGKEGGTTTDKNGKFTIEVPDAASTLVFTYVGFTLQEVNVAGKATIDVTLQPESKALGDVVVVGYGKQKKVNLVGAVSAVNIDEKTTSRAIPNIASGLEGMVPGLAITQNSGMAGNNQMDIIIRGLGTINNSKPLVVVDGVPDVDINRVNVNDIESVSVLKDATSSAVYGSRAANGVILITTRSGKGQKRTNITFNTSTAVTTPTKGFSFMADYPRSLTLEQRKIATTLPYNQFFKNGTIDQWMALGMIDPLRYPNTDWWSIIMQNGSFQNYNISASGGGDKSNFYMSAGMQDQQGLQINNTYRQYNARFSFDYKLRDNMNAGAKFSGNWSQYQYALAEGFTDPDPNNTAGTDMQYAIAGITPYDPKTGYYGGVMAFNEDPQAYNPYTVYQNNLNHTNRQEALAQMYFDWTPIKGLTGGIDYSLQYYNQFNWSAPMPNQAFNFQTGTYGSRVYVGPNAGVSNTTFTGYKTLLNARLNYQHTFAQHHDVSALFVYSEEYWYDRAQGSARNDRLYPTLHEIDAALTDIQSTSGNSSEEGLRSYIGRVNYTAYGKYLFEANMRVDGSSKFLPGSQYGYFPSVAAGWRFTEENFIRDKTEHWLNSGKLRASYGSLGNNTGVGRYEQQPTLATNNYIIGGVVQRGFVNTKMVNPDLTWETTTVLNIGMDLTFLRNRLSASIDFYNRKTTGMEQPSSLSSLLSGAYSPAPNINVGDMLNRGVELDLSWRDHVGQVSYSISGNVSYNQNSLLSWSQLLLRGQTSNGAFVFVNMPYNYIYTYKDIGIAQTWQDIYNNTPQGAQPGDILRKDVNGDGRIDGNDMVAYTHGSRNRPTTNFGLNTSAAYKGFDIVLFLQGSAGRKDFWLNAFNNVNFGNQRYAATWDHWNNPWSLDNRAGIWPRLGGSGNNTANTTFWLDDMSYLRFKNIQLGYNVPKKWLARAGIYSLRIAASFENIGTITSYRGLDPEKAGSSNNLYPINKSYAISANLGF
jgi:TonB-linked SusC/RagA family outer membrane protein